MAEEVVLERTSAEGSESGKNSKNSANGKNASSGKSGSDKSGSGKDGGDGRSGENSESGKGGKIGAGAAKKIANLLKTGLKTDGRVIFGAALLLGVLFLLITTFIFTRLAGVTPSNVIVPLAIQVEESVRDEEQLRFEMTKMDGMIQKANALYLRGEMQQALEIYEQIAIYSESLSNYNLGVAQMSQQNYAAALEAFKKAIASNENQTVAAINAAVCALHLKDRAKFEYYLDLAYVHLPDESGSQLFNYYLSLIYYYKGFYPEALQMLQKIDNEIYADDAKYLSAKIYAKLGLNDKALQNLQAQGSYETSLSTGLLYARMGDYDKAMRALERSMKIDKEQNESIAALNLIDLKIGNYDSMLARTKEFFGGEENLILDRYKIKVRLKQELSNIQLAQRNFNKDFMPNQRAQAGLLFYFTPYQVFDTKQAANYINKANVSNYIQKHQNNLALLSASSTLSSVNVKIAKIISNALNHRLKEANRDFENLLKSYKEHSILHYNLALSYAQLEKFDLAYKHFTTSYHLDPRNYGAGAYAVLAGNLSGADTKRLMNEINENMRADSDESLIYHSLMSFASGDYIAMMQFLDSDAPNTAFNLIVKIITAKNNNLHNQSDTLIAQLKELLSDDLMANILFFNSRNSNLNIKEYSQNAQIYFKDMRINYTNLANGANVVMDDYVALMRICGILNQEREKIKQTLALSESSETGLITMLAYMSIYAGQYEEAYGLYDILINDYKIKDSRIYFLAAVSAIGANNPNTAIALLELAKVEDPFNQEATLALALLYHEVQNYEPALFQYSRVRNHFQSEFFTFDLGG